MISEEQIDRDIARGRPVSSFYKPARPFGKDLLGWLLWDRVMHSRFPKRCEDWLLDHWPTGMEMWDY